MENHESYAADLQRAVELLTELARHPGASDKDSEAIDAFIDEMQRPVVTIKTEPFPSSPREDDNAGVMFCKHPRYTLGDTDADDPTEEHQVYTWEGVKLTEDQYDHAYECLTGLALTARTDEGRRFWNASLTALARDGEWNAVRTLRDDVAIAIPLSLYDHSGITIYHGGPRYQWDSGCVGIHYMTRKTLDSVFGGDEERARACMEAELKTYDQFLRGNVWYFTVGDRTGKTNECVGGFIGDDLDETGILEYADEGLEQAFRDAWEKRFDR